MLTYFVPNIQIPRTPKLTFLNVVPSTSNLTTYSANFDVESSGLLIIGTCGLTNRDRFVSAISIEGNSVPMILNPSGDWSANGLACKRVAPGTIAVTATFSGEVSAASIGAWLLQNNKSDVPISANGANLAGGTTINRTLNMVKDSVACAVHIHNNANVTNWTGATPRYDNTVEVRMSYADFQAPTDLTPHTFTASYSGDNNRGMSVAAWR